MGCELDVPAPSTDVPASTSFRISCISSPCRVSFATLSFRPLNSGGLWLPVIIIPPCTSSLCSEKYWRGVGHRPTSTTLTPLELSAPARAPRTSCELSLASRPMLILSPSAPALSLR